MIITSAHRASRVLFTFLKSNFENNSKPWLLPANICDCVPETFDAAGVKYEYADINPYTWCIEQSIVMSQLNCIAGLLYVHTYGIEDTPDEFFRQLKEYNPEIVIIDDRCLCQPSLSTHSHYSDMELYSTGAKKFINLNGGGYSIDNQRNMDKGINDLIPSPQDGWQYDLNKLKAEKAKVTVQKNKLNKIYSTNLPASIQLSDAYQQWRFNIMVDNKDEILKALFDNGLFASGHYKSQSDSCPNAQYLYEHVINLFNDFYYTEEQAMRTCRIINDILKYGI